MGRIISVLGGTRSGKSRFAAGLAPSRSKKVAFVATCLACDKEMKKRIQHHKSSRPSEWTTFEGTKDLAALFKKIRNRFDVIVLDCLTLWISGLLTKDCPEDKIRQDLLDILEGIHSSKAKLIVVSNEVGLGVVPEHALGRRFRDIAGRMNQLLTQTSDDVYFLVAGLPWNIKINGKIKTNS
ncbi:MAG: bifunctional adenosylcobinamide kinase/adenosylcobinamide-phosphate guanylyltransferase [Candidatus Omnitrophica bacterium]|nr:bifunctional adenosylcobinamide kinase/adenosylcobinamide-phosphate guanylyltransferase [Candidatus Omnitrophota bacterium]MDD5574019.1 bifunctional adenosylcobinamide kinase/adenosylcobinamide-phosphate guanylyltransferase [Candidatus Omnitrophota bacterium]